MNSEYVQVLNKLSILEAISKDADATPAPATYQAIIGTSEDSEDGAELPGLVALC
jgi:hypothetical protein